MKLKVFLKSLMKYFFDEKFFSKIFFFMDLLGKKKITKSFKESISEFERLSEIKNPKLISRKSFVFF